VTGGTPPIRDVEVAAYRVPTDAPESDGTATWDATTLVLVRLHAAGRTGIGYTYAGPAAATVVAGKLAGVVRGRDASTPAATWAAMHQAVRNLGRPGLVAEAISAVDIAAWDLHARLLDVPLAVAAGAVHDAVPVYGSGGFTSYDRHRLTSQLGGWAAAGIGRVKMKVGRDPAADPARVRAARDTVGPDVELFVDANGAYSRKQALALAGCRGSRSP
jgi:L-alanine-DL-glutamate epimerase-like enolase superfamily enzyme